MKENAIIKTLSEDGIDTSGIIEVEGKKYINKNKILWQ